MPEIRSTKVFTSFLVVFFLYQKGASLYIDLDEGLEHVIPANQTSIIEKNISSDTVFAVIQIHTQRYNLSVSSGPEFFKNATKIGSSVGLTTFVGRGKSVLTWYIRVNSTENVTAVVSVELYTKDDPVPGGCNQVFSLENDPSIVLTNGLHWTNMWFQWSNAAAPLGHVLPDCENKTVSNWLRYDIYVTYLSQRDLSESEFLSTMKKVNHVKGILAEGMKIKSLKDGETAKSQVKVAAQANQGALYSVIVTRLDTDRQAAYVTTATYSCDLGKTCTTSSTALQIIFAILLGFCGIYLVTVGHRFFKATQMVFGFIFTSLFTYIMMSLPHTVDESVKLGVSLTLGLIGGALWLAFWHFFSFMIMSVFLAGLCSGYLVASTLFFTPFGNINWWTTELNYGMAFACVLLIFAVLLMAYTRVLSIVSCALVGAYMFLMCLAIPLRSSLVHIFLNALYHQTEEDYLTVWVVFPFHAQDIILLTLWPVLTAAGMIFQFYREPSSRPKKWPKISHTVVEDDDGREKLNVSTGTESSEERRRLLPERASQERRDQPSYQSTRNVDRERNFLT